MMGIGPKDALIVVDVQRDFCPGGALAVHEGDLIVPSIVRIRKSFQTVAFTRDWHPRDHCSFSDDPQFVDGSWPVHCVAETPGAMFHRDLDVPEGSSVFDKGMDKDVEVYNGFQGTDLERVLRAGGVRRVFVCGLATDYCVKETVLGALSLGFETHLLSDACRPVDAGSGAEAIDAMVARGAILGRAEALEL